MWFLATGEFPTVFTRGALAMFGRPALVFGARPVALSCPVLALVAWLCVVLAPEAVGP